MNKKNGALPKNARIADILCRIVKNDTVNRICLLKQRKAAVEYIDTNIPGAVCSQVAKTADGWFCVASRGEERIGLYFTSDNGGYIFQEEKI